jgi:hypothetical protein
MIHPYLRCRAFFVAQLVWRAVFVLLMSCCTSQER